MDKVNNKLNDNIPSNDEIVDSLVKNLENSCELKSEEASSKEDENRIFDDTNLDNENAEISKKKNSDDFIDEEYLKEKEKSYTDEDKERLKLEAAELKKTGNQQFKNHEFKEAAETYTLALRTCPLYLTKERAVLYANRAAAKLNLLLNETAIEDCTEAIKLDPNYIKAIMRRAQLYEKCDKLDESLEDYKKILELDPGNKEAIMANVRLPPLINERNEKLKTEMLGKLKDLGNMVLKPFGLSTNNFKMVPNESGGYSINFQQ